jgi:predicted ArsR family transcriptional regulator
MASPLWSESFLGSTRGRVLTLLRAGPATVEELAKELELTDNAVRVHLAALERDGLVRSRGPRREGAVGKPATLYEVTVAAETALSRAYVPLLTSLLTTLGDRTPTRELRSIMRDVGKRLGDVHQTRNTSLTARVEAGSELLNSLGGVTQVKRDGKTLRIQGASCPLSVAVSVRPEVCEAVRAMLTGVVGAEVTECCSRGERNQCSFAVSVS